MQEADSGAPKTELETWKKMKQKKLDFTKPQPSLPKYYGTAKEDLDAYCEVVKTLHPCVDDPIREETDDTSVVLAGHGFQHGRTRVLPMKVRPTSSFTRLKATVPVDRSLIPPRRTTSGTTSTDVSFFPFLSSFRHLFLHG